ncbi:hypothetical protein [Aquimarina sp. 2201CG5-10]|uniref:hypothetical protein n=1 Tax=Aquimarina callyspongiae TaxID=3098150 RepID=UPI002AB5DA77|nr:hypothetical protein [Aquimarina sp. 2201CG5-10]MDY8138141.1 hypothetical protein [Aquimarina sp. 2201CG5-10]
MNYNYKILFSSLFTLFLNTQIQFVYSQSVSNTDVYYKWFDTTIGNENTGLYNGTIFINQYRTINEKHRFFKIKDFINGTIIYNDQKYYDIPIQYDINKDQLITKLKLGYGEVALQLVKDKVQEFTLDNTRFINVLADNLKQNDKEGFYEVLLDTPMLTLFKKHLKSRRKRVRNGQVYYEFISNYNYMLFYDKKYIDIKNRKIIIETFPSFKNEIISHYSIAKKLQKSDPDAFKKSLFKKIEGLISKTDKEG